MKKFITLSTDPSSYGSEFDPEKLNDLNTRIEEAASQAGITVLTDHTPHEDDERDYGDEIDWFARWCGPGFRHGKSQWADWFLKQTEK